MAKIVNRNTFDIVKNEGRFFGNYNMKKVFDYYLLLIDKYNEVLAINVAMVILLSMTAIAAGLIEGFECFINFTIIIFLLYAPSYFIGNKMRTCPSCKSWKHNILYSVKRDANGGFKIECHCKRCQQIW
jgi:hypothetical protein